MKTISQYRYMYYDGITFVEQAKKNSFYGKLAEEGKCITWGHIGSNVIPAIRLVDDTLYIYGKKWDGGEIVLKR